MRCALANLYPFSVPHLARGFQVCWRIVIAGHDDDRAAALSEKRGEKVIVLRLGGLWRMGGVEDVSGDHQKINLLVADGRRRPVS